MRIGERCGEVFDPLLERGEFVIHASELERVHALARLRTDSGRGNVGETLLIADTREQVAELNDVIRDRQVSAAHVDDRHSFSTTSGTRLSAGDRVAARRNDPDLGGVNRDTWTVTHDDGDADVTITGRGRDRVLPSF